ncbi:uncharacterized protein TNCV_1666321 [Trichonephila clavipes]|nr:uncharacterized protein TNCV_1666321 [Trichonephila clavipes]
MLRFPFIYVYCDLVEPQIVGDIQSPLLKVVKVEGKDEVVNSHYTRPHYVPVIRQHFQPIELNLRLHSANDLLEGRNSQESAEERAKETGRILAKKAIKNADDMLCKGKAYKRKKKETSKVSHSIESKEEEKRRDIFDTQ